MAPPFLFRLLQIIAKQELPDPILKDLASYVGCVSGAIQVNQYHDLLAAAGFQGTYFEPLASSSDLDIKHFLFGRYRVRGYPWGPQYLF